MNNSNLKLKICGIKEVKNMKYIYKYIKTYFIGLIFYSLSPRYVQKLFFITKTKQNISKVGVFVNYLEIDILNTIKKYNLDFVQLHGKENLQVCKTISKKGIKIIKTFNIDKEFSFKKIETYTEFCVFFLFDSKNKLLGGSGNKLPWKKLISYNLNIPSFLSGGINYKDLESLFKYHHPKVFVIDLNSKFESCPGIKNIKKLNLNGYLYKYVKNVYSASDGCITTYQ